MIPLPYRMIAAALAALLALGGAYLAGRTHGKAAVQLKWDAQVSRDRAAALAATEAARQVEQERAAAAQKVVDDAKVQTAAARRDADAAWTAAVSLRDAAERAAGRCAAGNPPAAAASASAGRVLAQVLGEVEAAGRQLAAEADQRGIAGRSCEQAYDSLLKPVPR